MRGIRAQFVSAEVKDREMLGKFQIEGNGTRPGVRLSGLSIHAPGPTPSTRLTGPNVEIARRTAHNARRVSRSSFPVLFIETVQAPVRTRRNMGS